MSTEGASSPSRRLPSLLGVLLLLMGLALLAGGIKLSMLGGSLYYVLAGIGLTLTGLLLLAGKRAALGLYALVLFASTLWSLWEIGLDWWQLVPRLSLWFALGVVLLLPWFRRPLLRDGPAPIGTAALSVAVVLAGGAAIGSQFTNPGEISGDLGRDSTDMASTAPAMPDGDWQAYGRTEFGDRYSPLKQITPANIGKLQEAWRIRTGDMPTAKDPVEITNQNTPLKVNGKLYACTAHSQVLALDPDTGKEIWRFDPQIQGPNGDDFRGWAHMTCRGVSYYDEANFKNADAISQPATLSPAGQAIAASCPRRLFLPTADARLIAINADTGKVCEDFGNKGAVDLKAGIGPFTPGGYYSTSPAAITRNLVIIGGHVTDNESTNEPSGVIRAFDAHDGHLVWNWDSGNPDETAPLPEGQTYTRNSPNMWSLASVDEKLGMVYLPLGNQMPDQWGGNRTAGAEKFSAGTVALDIDTGKLRWNYQFTHHDLWDMDVGSQPTLLDMKTADGVKPALIQPTKQGSLYVLDRRDGTPIVPIREVPAPTGAVEGDHTAPTQARSDLNLLPPPLDEKAMWGATPFDQMLCRIQFKELRYEGQYTPPSVQGSLIYPGNVGVFNWGSVSLDPVRQLLFTSPNYMAFVSKLVPRAEVAADSKRESETSGVQPNTGAPYAVIMHPFMSPLGVPCQAPAWGYVAGIDLTTNKVVWKHKNGTSRDSSPIPIGLPIGVPSMGGSMVTGGGVGFLSGTLDQYIRAYDVKNGKELWKSRLPAGGQATPMSYTGKDGQQYVLVVVGGHGSLGTKMGDYIIAYKLAE
ncbi:MULTISPECIES: glucose/quinate/shikimate family membrane-bound PQQ-dependent dehydrogenase [Pseudomonas chlororaphis group]|uniref:glucose/quinate/shikimate family membrane-bound PQQ-dependent dehydrogenase n=1 Tax=Pseudomonas chlororaphis group TaxID=136842 RepID=UPI000D849584|nr:MULTISPECIES: glucose/quinate/shikimate family membrane-bound PQQ-dependent dehydrogenase [Pseudomonas chlororaphis group]MCO7580532.1 glucose/quinate/shikimate family membrane-bound PQQ-dependent dehydrogenase [Pseudomonas protegens]MCO7586598.1 glucose/quinate/shikimate family membrane-bound PQQ-dependent dehydrogenase [Pseudomonas chlororaphis]MCO7600672.1 glucose/quinate/shikimate family membrane-bound PQQ-dependent dehydrogenase [Pseudomonas chlororaphis]MCY7261328.1 glucose/quinate/shi